jgi:hypothetical protein
MRLRSDFLGVFGLLVLVLFCLQPAFATPSTPTRDFIDNGDGTATHRTTLLTWMRCSMGQTWTGSTCLGEFSEYTWDEAMALKINFAGYSDWRLPNRTELRSIMEMENLKPSVNEIIFPNMNPTSVWFWTSEDYQYAPKEAQAVGFARYTPLTETKRDANHSFLKSEPSNVRLVRGPFPLTNVQHIKAVKQDSIEATRQAKEERIEAARLAKEEAKERAEQKRAAAAEAKCMRSASCRAEKQQQQVINAIRDADRNASRRAACLSEVRNCEANCRNGFYDYPGICIQQQCQRNCN